MLPSHLWQELVQQVVKLQVGDGDFFWESNGSAQFPEMAGNVDVQLKQYQEV